MLVVVTTFLGALAAGATAVYLAESRKKKVEQEDKVFEEWIEDTESLRDEAEDFAADCESINEASKAMGAECCDHETRELKAYLDLVLLDKKLIVLRKFKRRAKRKYREYRENLVGTLAFYGAIAGILLGYFCEKLKEKKLREWGVGATA